MEHVFFVMLWQGTMEINGRVNASFRNGLGETQAILIHSDKLRHRAKALKTFFPMLQESITRMLIRYLGEWFQLVRHRHQGMDVSLGSVVALSLTRGKLPVGEGEGRDAQNQKSLLLCTLDSKYCRSVATVCLQ